MSRISLESNGSALFDELTARCIFEDAVEDYKDQDQFYDAVDNQASADFWLNDAEYYHHESVTRYVNACLWITTNHHDDFLDFNSNDPLSMDDDVYSVHELEFLANGSPRIHTPSAVDYNNMCPYFAWQSTDIIEATFKNSTQYGFMPTSSNSNLFKRYRSPNPGANIPRLYDGVMTNSICSDTPAIDGGKTVGQCFFGRRSKFNHAEKMKTTKSYLRALQACIQQWGAPD